MSTEERAAALAECRELEVLMRGIIRHNAYFGSHRGYIRAQERKRELINRLRAA